MKITKRTHWITTTWSIEIFLENDLSDVQYNSQYVSCSHESKNLSVTSSPTLRTISSFRFQDETHFLAVRSLFTNSTEA